jgi:hypothetical protein
MDLRLLGGPGRQVAQGAACRRGRRTAGACRAWSVLHGSDAGRRQPAARRPRQRRAPPRLPAQPAARPARSPGPPPGRAARPPAGAGADLLGDTANGAAGVVDRLATFSPVSVTGPTQADGLLGGLADLVQRPGARPAGAQRRLADVVHRRVVTVLSSASRIWGCGRSWAGHGRGCRRGSQAAP